MMIFRIVMTVLGCILAVANLTATVTDKTPASRASALFQAIVFAGLIYFVWFG